MNVGDRVRFDGKSTSWLIRAEACEGRYYLATCSMFGKVYYTIIDHAQAIRGPMNVIGHGLGIFTTSGPDKAIDDAVGMLEGTYLELGSWEVSRRGQVPLSYTMIRSKQPLDISS